MDQASQRCMRCIPSQVCTRPDVGDVTWTSASSSEDADTAILARERQGGVCAALKMCNDKSQPFLVTPHLRAKNPRTPSCSVQSLDCN